MDRGEEMLLRAYDAARESNEHHSSARAQYLGFFFTILFAGTAYLGSLAKDGELDQAWHAVTAAGLLWLITLLSVLTFVAVAKFGRVMDYQGGVAARIRDSFLTEAQEELFKVPYKVKATDPYPHPLFTVQRSAEATILAGAALSIAGQIALAIHFSAADATVGVRVILWALAATSLVGGLGVWLRRSDVIVLSAEIDPEHPKKRRTRPDDDIE